MLDNNLNGESIDFPVYRHAERQLTNGDVPGRQLAE